MELPGCKPAALPAFPAAAFDLEARAINPRQFHFLGFMQQAHVAMQSCKQLASAMLAWQFFFSLIQGDVFISH